MKKVSILLLVLIFNLNYFVVAQNWSDSVLLEINNKEVSLGEFYRIYQKNNVNTELTEKSSVDDYLDLFINFKLKVAEAESLGMDTAKSFITELSGYRKQLAKPYLVDKKVDESLLREAYDRLKWDIKASHILIRLDQNPTPKDTLEAWNKINSIRARALKGENFSKLAEEYSEDPSAKKNKGQLGYFTGFQMVYPFESAAFNTKPGQISKPVRTRFGYHIIKVEDKRPASGQVRVAHIMVAVADNADPESKAKALAKANNLYQQISEGADFAELARKFSDDKGSAPRGGELPVFGTGKMVPEFEQAAFSLKNAGDVSKPVKTSYGYHIIKLLDKKGLAPFEEMESDLKSKIQRDERAGLSRIALISELKSAYNFKEYPQNKEKFFSILPDTLRHGNWEGFETRMMSLPLFEIDKIKFSSDGLLEYLKQIHPQYGGSDFHAFLNEQYIAWVDQRILQVEDAKLEDKYPDFRYLMQEYHDGILLFELSDKLVWSKAVKDTSGLKAFYEKNKNNYMWEKRANVSIYTLNLKTDSLKPSAVSFDEANKKALDKLRKIALKRQKKGWNADQTKQLMQEQIEKFQSNYNVTIEDGLFQKNDHYLMDQIKWEKGISENYHDNGELIFVVVNKIEPVQAKKLDEIRGLMTADYQNFLEAEWIKELRNKYDVKINYDLLKKIDQLK